MYRSCISSYPIERWVTILLLSYLGLACERAKPVDSMDNTIALFEANGAEMSSTQREEIRLLATRVFSYNHLQNEINQLAIDLSDYRRNCHLENETKMHDLKQRNIAIQVVSFHNKWQLAKKDRLNLEGINCTSEIADNE